MMCRLVLENKSTMLKFTWLPGRQANCIYHKLLFLWIKIPFLKGPVFADGWIIRYPPHAELPMHRDSIKKYASVIYRDRVYECTLNNPRHYRLNIQLWGRGKFLYEGKVFKFGPIVFFRPDIIEHGMRNGSSFRYVLSIGWVI